MTETDKPTPAELAKKNRAPIVRILATTGRITQADRETVLAAAYDALQQMRDTNLPSVAALFAAALCCKADDGARADHRDRGREAIERMA